MVLHPTAVEQAFQLHDVGYSPFACHRAVAQIKGIRENVQVGIIIDQEVIELIITGTVRHHSMDQFVDIDAVDQGQAQVSEPGDVFESGRVIHEPALQAGGE